MRFDYTRVITGTLVYVGNVFQRNKNSIDNPNNMLVGHTSLVRKEIEYSLTARDVSLDRSLKGALSQAYRPDYS